MMRAMVLEYPEDPACAYLDRQYFLGDSLLVAPIFSAEGTVSYYLPAGSWFNVISGERVQGGRWRDETHGYKSLPLMAREGSLIAYGSQDSRPDYDYAQGAAFTLYGLPDGATASAKVFSVDGKLELEVAAARTGETLTVKAAGDGKPWKLVLRGLAATSAAGAKLSEVPGGWSVEPAAYAGSFSVSLKAE
jgi:alpha-D-xyloside xylohydrolase